MTNTNELRKEIKMHIEYCVNFSLADGEPNGELIWAKSDQIMQLLAKHEEELEIEIRKGILVRIRLNESNDYPLVDESKSLADIKEAQVNRIIQLTKNSKGENK